MRSVKENLQLYKFLGGVQFFLGFVLLAAVLYLVVAVFRLVALFRGES